MTREGRIQVEPNYEDEAPQKKSRLFMFLILAVIVLVIVGGFTMLQRRSQWIIRHSLVCSSIRFSIRAVRPSCVLALTKS